MFLPDYTVSLPNMNLRFMETSKRVKFTFSTRIRPERVFLNFGLGCDTALLRKVDVDGLISIVTGHFLGGGAEILFVQKYYHVY
jgi:hypothetical protein